ncbi:MAG: hypothetical protein JW810_10130 [Sedimentisphaerales bacterium]|nr:hypothetical protein [Sedimentisphaerales bacterium]
MSRFAKVGSLDALKELRTHLCLFSHTAATALEEAGSESQRLLIWLKQTQYRHWKVELRRRTERFQAAKLELKRKQDIETSPLGGSYSFIDEKKALAAAQRALEEAQRKLKNIQRWIPLLERESLSFRGSAQGLMDLAEVGIPNACAALDRMMDSLEAYLKLAPEAQRPEPMAVAAPESAGDLAELSSMARSDDAPPAGPPGDYAALRKNTPPPETRQNSPRGTCPDLFGGAETPGIADLPQAIHLADNRDPVADEQTVLIGPARGGGPSLYMERCRPAGPGDSGWFVGCRDLSDSTGDTDNNDNTDDPDNLKDIECRRVPAGELLGRYPALAGILDLPVGCLVVWDGPAVQAVVDAENKVRWRESL